MIRANGEAKGAKYEMTMTFGRMSEPLTKVQKLHLLCNEMGDVLTFCLTPANVDDRDPRVWQVFTKVFYGKYLPIRATSNKNSLRISSTKASISFMGSNQT